MLPNDFLLESNKSFRVCFTWNISLSLLLYLHKIFILSASMFHVKRCLLFCSREQRAKQTCLHVHLAVLCTSGTRLAPTKTECRIPRGTLCVSSTCLAPPKRSVDPTFHVKHFIFEYLVFHVEHSIFEYFMFHVKHSIFEYFMFHVKQYKFWFHYFPNGLHFFLPNIIADIAKNCFTSVLNFYYWLHSDLFFSKATYSAIITL